MKPVTGTALSIHLDCTRETIGSYVAAGIVERRRDGYFDLDVCRRRVLRHLRARAGGRSGYGGDADLSRARAALTQAQTESAVLKNAQAKAMLVNVDLVRKHVEADYFLVRESLLNLPGSLADSLAEGNAEMRMRIEAKLTDAIFEVLTHLSNGDDVAARAAGKRGGNGSGAPTHPLSGNKNF